MFAHVDGLCWRDESGNSCPRNKRHSHRISDDCYPPTTLRWYFFIIRPLVHVVSVAFFVLLLLMYFLRPCQPNFGPHDRFCFHACWWSLWKNGEWFCTLLLMIAMHLETAVFSNAIDCMHVSCSILGIWSLMVGLWLKTFNDGFDYGIIESGSCDGGMVRNTGRWQSGSSLLSLIPNLLS